MAKIDKSIIKNTLFVTLWVVIFSCLMQAVFLIINKWDYTVLTGNLLGAFEGILNFFLLGITVQKALTKEPKQAKTFMKMSQALRMFMLVVLTVVGAILHDYFNIFALVIPLLFPRIAILIYSFTAKKKNSAENTINTESENLSDTDDNNTDDSNPEEITLEKNTPEEITTEKVNADEINSDDNNPEEINSVQMGDKEAIQNEKQ